MLTPLGLVFALFVSLAGPGSNPGAAQELRLPAGQPRSFEVEVLLGGRLERMVLAQHSLRSSDASVLVYGAGGRLREVKSPAVTTYRGSLVGDSASVVLASLVNGQLTAEVLGGPRGDYTVEPLAEHRGLYSALPKDHDHERFETCGVDDMGFVAPTSGSNRIAGQPPVAGQCLTLCEIAFDADFEYYQKKGSTVAGTIAAIDAIMNQVDYFYARDVLITYELTQYVIRAAPYYTPTTGGDLLDQFRAEWNTTLSGVQRDIAHLMTAKPGSIVQYGGLAWVGVVCTNSGYGWSMDGANIVGHEVGHNWAAGHCLDPTPCNNMCGACLNVAPNTKRVIEAHRDSRGCVESTKFYPTQLPPYAHPEGIALNKSDYDDLGPTTFDVLRNDHDGNCEELFLESFDAMSAQGGRVTRSFGTGGMNRDELVYTPPAAAFVGADTFNYVVADPRGGRTVGTVTVDVRPLELQAYWAFDEGTGQTAGDTSRNDFDAVALQPTTWSAGILGTALDFDGVAQRLSSSGASFEAPWSVSAWFKRTPGSSPGAALAESPNGSLRTEQRPNTEKVGLTKYGDADYKFGYVAPFDTWVHLTFVGTEEQTALYVDGQFTASRPVSIQAPILPASNASDPLSGSLDDLRVYSYDLSGAEIDELYRLSGPAIVPFPRDGGKLASSDAALRWTSSPNADSHDVYFGESYSAVRDASTGSTEFVGNQLGESYVPGGVQSDRTYYWRVDEVVGAEVVRGSIWQFSLVDFHLWKLDEMSGTIAVDSQSGADGTYLGGPLLNQVGASPSLGTSVSFDGSNDRVSVPALHLNSDEVTITAWVRRDGAQSSFAGLVFSRAANTVAGLNFGNSNELRYHWNGSGSTWGWDSGLVVPDDEWVFVALVVEPDRATIHLGQSGVLSSAVNAVTHSIEEFDGMLVFGRDPTGGRHFRGLLDDVRVYRGALSSAAIDALYQDSL